MVEGSVVNVTVSGQGAALGYLVQRPEIDAARIGVYSISLASFWGLRFAAQGRAVKRDDCIPR